MKTLILFTTILAVTLLFSCQKSGTTPLKPKLQDTLSDSALFKVQLVNVADSLPNQFGPGRSESLIEFNHKYHLSFDIGEDASPPSLPGLTSPALNLMSLTSDGVPVIIDAIPYKAGVTVPLRVTVPDNGQYVLRVYYLRWFPLDIHIWCKDNFVKDSVDLRKGNYNFMVDRADTNQYGTKRFSLSLGPK